MRFYGKAEQLLLSYVYYVAKSTQQITVTALKPPPRAFKRKRIFSFALKMTEFH